MFHYRHQLHMGIPHFFDIGNQLCSDFTIAGICFLILPDYGAKVEFVYTNRNISCLEVFSGFQEFIVLPFERFQVRNDGSRLRAKLSSIFVRIRFQIGKPALQFHLKLIIVTRLCIRYKYFKDAGIPQPSHLVYSSIPTVEISYYAGTHHIGCPHGKTGALDTVDFHGMCSQFFIDGIVDTVFEFLRILFRDLRFCTVGLAANLFSAVLFLYQIMVYRKLAFTLGKQRSKESVLVCQFHLNRLPGALEYKLCPLCPRKICLHKSLPPGFMGSQQFMRIV